jgi:hypothetical protein
MSMKSIEFKSHKLVEIPPLAWLLNKSGKEGLPVLFHGAGVDVFHNWFFEGCFDGDFSQDAILAGSNVFGSGMVKWEGTYHFVTPSHNFEGLYLLQGDDFFSVSNSLSFLIEYHRLNVPFDFNYGARFASTVFGIKEYVPELFSFRIGKLLRFIFTNFCINTKQEIDCLSKPAPPSFYNFHQYTEYLQATLRRIFANGQCASRQQKYSPIATVSRGYDSPAVAAIAKKLGCSQAVTLREARGGASDCGKEVGDHLGIEVLEFDRKRVCDASAEEIGEFLAPGLGGEDYNLKCFEPLLAGRILLTGLHGDMVWDVNAKAGGVLARGDCGGMSLQEFCLRANFVHIPVPMIGATNDADLLTITRSEEMKPYRLYTDYDRPIPRRIVEEAGVPRHVFGQRKAATSAVLFLDEFIPSEMLSKQTKEMLRSSAKGIPNSRMFRLIYGFRRWVWLRRMQYYYRYVHRRNSLYRWLADFIISEYRTFEHNNPLCGVLSIAGIEITRRRYRAIHEISLKGMQSV